MVTDGEKAYSRSTKVRKIRSMRLTTNQEPELENNICNFFPAENTHVMIGDVL